MELTGLRLRQSGAYVTNIERLRNLPPRIPVFRSLLCTSFPRP